MQHWAADRETVLHARLAGMKAGLGLRADQENLWSPLASAIEDAFKSQTEAMQEMMKTREGTTACPPSTVWTSWPAVWLKTPQNSRQLQLRLADFESLVQVHVTAPYVDHPRPPSL